MKNREEIIKELIKDKSVLDVGSSWGDFKDFVRKNSKEYKSLDIESGADYVQNLEITFDLEKKFDVIIAGEVIEHVENTGVFLENMKWHLKTDGILILTTPNPTSFRFFFHGLFGKEPSFSGHVNYFTMDSIGLLLNRYFNDTKLGFCHYTTNKGKTGLGVKYRIECSIGDLIPRFSSNIITVSKN